MKFTKTYSGQKKRYGDTFHEYVIESDLPREEVEAYCVEHIERAIPYEEYKATITDLGSYFRPYYFLIDKGQGQWMYQVVITYCD